MKQESKKFFGGMLLGAIVGGAITLLDKETRKTVFANVKKTGSNVTYYIKNPQVVVDQVKDGASRLRTTVEQVSEDISFIAEKVEQLKEVTPAVTDLVKDTQEAFSCDKKEFETETGNKPF